MKYTYYHLIWDVLKWRLGSAPNFFFFFYNFRLDDDNDDIAGVSVYLTIRYTERENFCF